LEKIKIGKMKKIAIPVFRKLKKNLVRVPGSKSVTNRVFLLAALADGISEISGALESDDTKFMAAALEKLGVKIEKLAPGNFRIFGTGGKFLGGEKNLFLGNAGTATRFLTAVGILRREKTVVDGNARMRQRPIADLISGLEKIGAKIAAKNGCPPVEIFGPENFAKKISMSGKNSSQYFSAIFQIAPLLPAGLEISVDGILVSQPYIKMTIEVMKKFGVEVENKNYEKFLIAPQKFLPQKNFAIEGDASSATYFLALAAVTGQKITVENVGKNSVQGDTEFADVLEKMGCRVEKFPEKISVTGPQKLKNLGKINLNKIPDAAMTVAIVAAAADGPTEIFDVENMRIKETDRIAALACELKKCGVDCAEKPDGILVRGGNFAARKNAIWKTYDDHRMAMCGAVFGATNSGIEIENPNCTAKTFPDFFEKWAEIYE